MAFVDFSDPEDMFALLIDYVTDERSAAEDPQRRRFLSGLLDSLAELQGRVPSADFQPRESSPCARCTARLESEFECDPVAQHLEDCAAELERVSERAG